MQLFITTYFHSEIGQSSPSFAEETIVRILNLGSTPSTFHQLKMGVVDLSIEDHAALAALLDFPSDPSVNEILGRSLEIAGFVQLRALQYGCEKVLIGDYKEIDGALMQLLVDIELTPIRYLPRSLQTKFA